jgi:hypothetical protein
MDIGYVRRRRKCPDCRKPIEVLSETADRIQFKLTCGCSWKYGHNDWWMRPRLGWRDRAASFLEWTLFIGITAGVGFPIGLMLYKLTGVRIKVGILIGVVAGAYACYLLSPVIDRLRKPH